MEHQASHDQRILILAPTGRDGDLTSRVFGHYRLQSEVCAGPWDLCERLQGGAGLVFVTGEALTSSLVRSLVEVLKQQPTWSDIPLVILTSGGGDLPANAEELATLVETGNVTLIERPVRVMTLVSAVESALRARRRQFDVRDYLAAEQRAKDELTRAIQRAEEANSLKDEFLATVSHELRTPLMAVLGWAHLLRSNNLDETGQRRAIETIERNARAQQQLIEDLLDVSRIITGKLRLDVRPVVPEAFIAAAVESVRPAADAKEIKLEIISDPNIGTLSGDAGRLQQVVWNLLSNAIKFTPRAGRVRLEVLRTSSHVEISVHDSGQGISADFLPYVFERFRQADMKTTRAHGGLGLGLAIVRQLVELHGGTVKVMSDGEGEGAVFVVKLPVLPVYANSPARGQANLSDIEADAVVDCASNLDGLKILVVDDEADTCELLRSLLTKCGADVTAARSASEAFRLFQLVIPEVLVSDIGMPHEDGYELMRKVRALPEESGGKVPAVALTAYARAEDRVRALRAGFQMHVSKPIELTELVAIVASLGDRLKKASDGAD
ncbi:MAG TPA: ATP-binding protein [Pyrinomonadaceae bacterium]|nr:ATP-binding protein [Pyrinomonadaceae bacterium]